MGRHCGKRRRFREIHHDRVDRLWCRPDLPVRNKWRFRHCPDSSGPDGRLLNGAAKVDRGDGMKATASLGISLVGSFGKQNFGGVYLHHTF